jgi:hypothetical protein
MSSSLVVLLAVLALVVAVALAVCVQLSQVQVVADHSKRH